MSNLKFSMRPSYFAVPPTTKMLVVKRRHISERQLACMILLDIQITTCASRSEYPVFCSHILLRTARTLPPATHEEAPFVTEYLCRA